VCSALKSWNYSKNWDHRDNIDFEINNRKVRNSFGIKNTLQPGAEGTSNPRYSAGRDQEDCDSKSARANSF
jgi:hypothetical protein